MSDAVPEVVSGGRPLRPGPGRVVIRVLPARGRFVELEIDADDSGWCLSPDAAEQVRAVLGAAVEAHFVAGGRRTAFWSTGRSGGYLSCVRRTVARELAEQVAALLREPGALVERAERRRIR